MTLDSFGLKGGHYFVIIFSTIRLTSLVAVLLVSKLLITMLKKSLNSSGND